jgi:hypothetical protein
VGKVRLADGEAARTACARVLVRGGADEKTGEHQYRRPAGPGTAQEGG